MLQVQTAAQAALMLRQCDLDQRMDGARGNLSELRCYVESLSNLSVRVAAQTPEFWSNSIL